MTFLYICIETLGKKKPKTWKEVAELFGTYILAHVYT